MSHYTNRYNFWNDNKQTIVLIDPKYSSYREFEGSYFKNETNFYIFFNLMRDRFNFGQDLKTLYSIFACDLEWAKKTVFCGGSGSASTTSGTNVFACVEAVHTSGRSYTADRSQLHITRAGGIKHVFVSNYGFIYLMGNMRKSGKWSCVGTNGYIITLTNGQTFSSTDLKWSAVPPKGGTPSQTPPTGGGTETNLTAGDLTGGKSVRIGMKGDIVGDIQKLLIKLGYTNVSSSGNSDNVFGRRTKQMVIDFQKANGLLDDGIVGKNTWGKLNDPAAVKNSTSSSDGSAKTSVAKDGETVAGSDVIIVNEKLKKTLRENLLKFN